VDNSKVLEEYGKYVNTDAAPSAPGRVASDLSRFDRRRSVQRAVQADPDAHPAQRRREEAPTRSRLSLGLLLMYCLIAGLAVLLISNYMNLTILTEDLSKLNVQLEELQNEEIILQKKFDERYILNDIETYAVNNLGMVKLESNMIEYIELSNPDTITMITPYQEDKVAGLFRQIGEKLRDFLEFLA